jgi:hypothetical protein
VLIDDHVMSDLAALVPLAPLHQPHNIARSVRSPQPASCRQFCNVGAVAEEMGWAVTSTPQKFIVEGNVGQLAKEGESGIVGPIVPKGKPTTGGFADGGHGSAVQEGAGVALLSMTVHWTGVSQAKSPFSAGSSNGGFWSRKVENA